MKPTAKAIYALEALIVLDVLSNDNYVPLQRIAEERNVSIKFLEQIFSICKEHRLVESKKGPNGGYRFMKQAATITVHDLFVALGNSFVVPNEENDRLYHDLQAEMDAVLQFYTIRSLADQYRTKIGSQQEFYI